MEEKKVEQKEVNSEENSEVNSEEKKENTAEKNTAPEDSREKTTKRKHKSRISRRIIGALLVGMGLMLVLLILLSSNAIRRIYYKTYTQQGQDLVRRISHTVDGDWLKHYAEAYEQDEKYFALKEQLDGFKTDFKDLQYLYIYKPEDTFFVYLIEAQTAEDDPDSIANAGEIYTYVEKDYETFVPDVRNQKASDRVVLGEDVGYGIPISSWAPIFDSNGDMVAMVEADYIISDIEENIRSSIAVIVGAEILCIVTVIVLMILYTRKNVVSPINSLTGIVDDYESGVVEDDLSQFRYDDEIKSLAESFKEMTHRNMQYIQDLTAVTKEKERIGAELNVAKKIQEDMLPRIFPPYPNRADFEIYASMDPAKEVGGDFYDLFLVDDDHIALVMADVSGKGVPAALFMVITKTLLKNRTMMGGTPAQIVSDVNDQLCEGNESEYFVTVWLAIIDLKTGDGTAVNAGHEHPILKKRDGEYELIKYRHAPPVGSMPGLPFAQREFHLDPGDMLFVYTDGVAEATDANEELYGTERLLEILNSQKQATPEELLHAVKEDVDRFVGEAPQFDDLTMMAFRIVG
ncbi:MAG: PP2C family protein-serine/threonine phosphatase [Lachnospiraceae bacterium]|nr:PP2C family protein-serine/threonine phosphatase [Lachnospiraceae bacterium]